MLQRYASGGIAVLFGITAWSAVAAPVAYEMDLRTQSGMTAGGGATGMMGAMFGSKGAKATKTMHLRIINPTDIPDDYSAQHIVPATMRIGPSLALKGERRIVGGRERDTVEEKEPKGRVLIYWGCSATVAKGQPEVIDFQHLGERVPPEVMAMARQSHGGKRGGEPVSLPPRALDWPNDKGGDVPAEASAVGDHLVKANFMQEEIRFALDAEMDFLEPLNLKAGASDLNAAIPLDWDALAHVKGYNLNAFGMNDDKETMVMWMASRSKHPMLPASQNTCTIPAGIFKDAQFASVSEEAVGFTRGFAYPPQRPNEPKKPLIWTVKVTVGGYDGTMLGMQRAAGKAATESVIPGAGLMNSVKGLFGK